MRRNRYVAAIVFIAAAALLILGVYELWLTGGQGGDEADAVLLSRLEGPLAGSDPRVLEALRSHYLTPPSTLPYNLILHKNIQGYVLGHRYSWAFYHHYITHFFGDQRSGFFLEAGALDGEFLSNSLWLETKMGWTGMLIEAERRNYQLLAKKHRRAWLSNTCITKESYPHVIVIETLERVDSLVRPLYYANNRPVNSFLETQSTDELGTSSQRSYWPTQCFPLSTYPLALNISTIDFLSLDIQGYEWEVVSSIIASPVVVRAAAVEHITTSSLKHNSSYRDQAFVSFMKQAGYNLVDSDEGTDYFFILASDPVMRNKSDVKNLIEFKKGRGFLLRK